MGWALWAVESALCLLAGYTSAAAIYPERGLPHRLLVALLISPSMILVVIQGCGLLTQLNPLAVGVAGVVVFGACLVIATSKLGQGGLASIVVRDLQACREAAHEFLIAREIGALNCFLGFAIFAFAALIIWVFRSWDWDCLVYHKTITDFTIQKQSVHWIDAYAAVSAFPRNVEWLAVWNCLFQRDNRLDDSPQFLFGVLACLVIVAWARRLGVQRSFAIALGASWIALPPVFLQLATSHNDIGCAALLGGAVYFLAEPIDRRTRWIFLLAVGLYVGTKFTALIPCMLLAVWFLARTAIEIYHFKNQLVRRVGDVVASLFAFAAVGLFKYIQNAIHTGNPLYPFRTRISLIGLDLAGPINPDSFDGDPDVYIFQGIRVAKKVFLSWFSTQAVYWPDVRIGGFGPLFAWILLPALVAMVVAAVWLRKVKAAMPILILFAIPLALPAPWWPRYTLATSIAGLLALGFVHGVVRWHWIRALLSLLLVVGTVLGFQRALSEAKGPGLKELRTAISSSAEQRAALQLIGWQWPTPWALQKETELQAGDGVAYDDGIGFPAEAFSHDYRTRVFYLPTTGNPVAYLQRLRNLNVKWVAVMRGTRTEEAVRAQGAEYLFTPTLSSSNVYRLSPRSTTGPPAQTSR